MFEQINDRIAMLKSKQRQRVNWEKRVKALEDDLKRKLSVRDQLAEQLQKEQKDVDQLTSLSLGALFYTLIGRKKEKLTKEEAELLQVKMNYENAADTATDIEADLTALKQQLVDVRYIDSDITLAIDEKTRLIEATNPALSAQLQVLTNNESEAQMNAKELKEAVSAGKAVLSSLSQAQDRLGSAKNWGTYDMLGGGLISTAIKHSRIDEARSAIHAAQRSLSRFQAELKDVQQNVDIQIDISGMLTFADYFFDGFITDWIVQGRIKDSLDQLSSKHKQTRTIVTGLETQLQKEEAKLHQLRHERITLIELAN